MHWIALRLEALRASASSGGPSNTLNGALNDAWADGLSALGWWALQFTPKVARVSAGADAGAGAALVMEISASERLFGGRGPLLHQLFQLNSHFPLVRHAQAATALVAIARLQMGGNRAPYAAGAARGKVQIGAGGQIGVRSRLPEATTPVGESVDRALTPICPPAPICTLPLHTLAAARPHLPTLARIGCNTWGDLRALPRGGVVRRFGADLLDALDRADGLKPEIYPWLTLPEVFEQKLELQAQVETAPALMFGAQRLLKQLQLWLQLRHCGVTALALGWTMDARRNTATHGELLLRTAQPTQDISHLQRLMAENLARLTLPAPVLYLHLRTLQTEKMAGVSASLLIEDIQKGDSLDQMVERLCARLGADSVLQLATHADHRPERMQRWQPVASTASGYAIKKVAIHAYSERARGQNGTQKQPKTTTQANPLRPTWLLAAPLKLAVRDHIPQCAGPLVLLAGPERIEAGWLDTPALRDYFLARSEQMGLLWIYRERMASDQWFLHGLFD